jgi:hypothetical protein
LLKSAGYRQLFKSLLESAISRKLNKSYLWLLCGFGIAVKHHSKRV